MPKRGPELDPFLRALASELKKRHMTRQLAQLRGYYKRYAAEKREARQREEWAIDDVFEWMALLGVKPFERHYPQQRVTDRCPYCQARNELSQTSLEQLAYGLGRVTCSRCGERWVVHTVP